MGGADKTQDFIGVGGNLPERILKTSCGGFAPSVPVSARLSIAFDISNGGNRVSVAPYILQDDALGPKGTDMVFAGGSQSGQLNSTVSGSSSKDGTVTVDIYVGIPALGTDTYTLTARPGSYIDISQP
jgi:hypothetical protein